MRHLVPRGPARRHPARRLPARRLLAPFAFCMLLAGVACIGGRAPDVPARGTLQIGAGDEGDVEKGPLRVVFGSPDGEIGTSAEVTLVFSRPMRALDLAGDEARSPATIEPAIPGRWQWVGTRALSFVPERAGGGGSAELPHATEYVVRVPAGTRALDGTPLESAYELRFRTARPEVVHSSPSAGSDGLSTDVAFELLLNQPVKRADLEAHLAATAATKPAAVKLEQPDPANGKRWVVRPATRWPTASPIELVISPGLRGTEGPLPTTEPFKLAVRTYGPLAVEGVSCDEDTPDQRCSITGGVRVELSNSVKVAHLKRAVRFEPAAAIRWPTWMEDGETTRYLSLDAKFVPGRSYTLRIDAGIVDEHGQALGQAFARPVAFGDVWPAAEIGISGSILEPTARKAIPVAYVNTRDLEVSTARLGEDALVDMVAKSRTDHLAFTDVTSRPGARTVKLQPGARNVRAQHLVRTDDALGGAAGRGPVAVGVRYDARPGRDVEPTEDVRIVQVTDLAVSAKLSKRGSVVWVTRLSTGAPVAGASVSVRRPGVTAPFATTTDATGFATIPADKYRPVADTPDDAVLVVRSGDDWTYRAADSVLSPWRLGVPFDDADDRPFGMVFTDRGIYRPGDVVELKGIIREEAASGTTTPAAGRKVHLQVQSPDGTSVATLDPVLTAFGTFSAKVLVPRAGRLGTYEIEAKVEGSPRSWADVASTFEVAEYRPAEFEVKVESDRPAFVRGDTARWTGRGDFLYGAPMSRAQSRTWITRSETSFVPPGAEDLVVDDAAYTSDLVQSSPHGGTLESNEGKLDDTGRTSSTVKLDLPGMRGTERLSAEVEVTDLSRQSIAASTTALVHPGEYYLGLERVPFFADAGKPIPVRVLAVTPAGQKVAGRQVALELVRRTWVVARREGAGGELSHVSKAVDAVVARCTTATAARATGCDLAPIEGGYHLLRATSSDGRGNPVSASDGFYVAGPGSFAWQESDGWELPLERDREEYEVGQTARILLKSPFAEAQALITVERAGVTTRRVQRVFGPAPRIEVPITEDLRPNAYVSVLLVRGRTKAAPNVSDKPDVGAPAFRLGYVELPIDPEGRRLSVTVTPNKTDLKPGEEVAVDLEVKDRRGKPVATEIALYAVDEGVLSLVGYKTPDPIPVFGATRPLRVSTLDSREALAKIFDPVRGLGLDKGADGGGGDVEGGTGVRRDFRASATFQPTLLTDENGRARTTFKLPDSLTTYRVMAVAVAKDDRFGYGEKRVVTSRPLMARPAFPRFLRAGDAFEAGVIVATKTPTESEVTVTIAASGAEVDGETSRKVKVAPKASVEVRFPMKVPRAGKATFAFTVRGGGGEDAVRIERTVQAPISMEAVALYGDTKGEAAEKLGDLQAIRGDVGELSLSMASTALVGLDGGMGQLLEYPYGCVEQLTSRLVPLVSLRQLARDFGAPLPGDPDAAAAVAVGKIIAAQRSDGGFGLWPESPRPSPWVTAYALWGLTEAKRAKVPVPTPPVDAGVRFLRRHLESPDLESLPSRAFVLYVLAHAGSPDPGRATRLFEERQGLPAFSKALLLMALVEGKGDRTAIDTLAKELANLVRLDGPVAEVVENHGDAYASVFDSEARTTAIVLKALLAADPKHALGARLAMGLLAEREGGKWRTTQESAWALLALADYRELQEAVVPDFDARVFFGESVLAEAPFHGRSTKPFKTEVATARLAGAGGTALGFTVEGDGKLFYEARLRYARKELPRTPLDRGFWVEKRIRVVKPETLEDALRTVPTSGVTTVAPGDLLLADVVVVTPTPRRWVVVDDPLPAGLEAVDARLATASSRLDVDSVGVQRSYHGRGRGDAEETGWYRREVRDDRVLFFADDMAAGVHRYRYLARATTHGTFLVPPTRAEEMYAPEVFGRSGAVTFTVQGAAGAK